MPVTPSGADGTRSWVRILVVFARGGHLTARDEWRPAQRQGRAVPEERIALFSFGTAIVVSQSRRSDSTCGDRPSRLCSRRPVHRARAASYAVLPYTPRSNQQIVGSTDRAHRKYRLLAPRPAVLKRAEPRILSGLRCGYMCTVLGYRGRPTGNVIGQAEGATYLQAPSALG